MLRNASAPSGGTRLLQYSLRFLDYRVGPVDGGYGPVTRRAVKAYQRDHRLVVDGITGLQTWRSLQRVVCFP
ncbi:MAG: peptidoglycan-binding domain-containing protein [Candidatus Nanopelagicales bacterium]